MMRRPILLAGLIAAAPPIGAAAPPPATIVTAAPLDATLQCFRDTLGGMGRLVTINTANGALLDYAFDTVAADGKIATARITFTIDDPGPTRNIGAIAASPADAPLARQLLAQTARTCLPEAMSAP